MFFGIVRISFFPFFYFLKFGVNITFMIPGGNVESGISENIREGSFDKSYCGSINSIAVSALDADVERNKGI